MPVDPTFGVNDFNEVKILTEVETKVNNILMILFGKPGFYPSIPSLGMDISQYLYMHEDEINTSEIKSRLVFQCKDFLADIESGEIDIYKTTHKGNTLLIFKLPIIISNSNISVALGVTLNKKGELMYNFEEVSVQK